MRRAGRADIKLTGAVKTEEQPGEEEEKERAGDRGRKERGNEQERVMRGTAERESDKREASIPLGKKKPMTQKCDENVLILHFEAIIIFLLLFSL